MARVSAGNSGPALACAPADVPSARPDGMSGRTHRSAIIGLSPPRAIDEKILSQPSSVARARSADTDRQAAGSYYHRASPRGRGLTGAALPISGRLTAVAAARSGHVQICRIRASDGQSLRRAWTTGGGPAARADSWHPSTRPVLGTGTMAGQAGEQRGERLWRRAGGGSVQGRGRTRGQRAGAARKTLPCGGALGMFWAMSQEPAVLSADVRAGWRRRRAGAAGGPVLCLARIVRAAGAELGHGGDGHRGAGRPVRAAGCPGYGWHGDGVAGQGRGAGPRGGGQGAQPAVRGRSGVPGPV